MSHSNFDANKNSHDEAGFVRAAQVANERIVTLFIDHLEDFKKSSDKLIDQVVAQVNLAHDCPVDLIRPRQIDMVEKALFAHQKAAGDYRELHDEIIRDSVRASSLMLVSEPYPRFQCPTWLVNMLRWPLRSNAPTNDPGLTVSSCGENRRPGEYWPPIRLRLQITEGTDREAN